MFKDKTKKSKPLLTVIKHESYENGVLTNTYFVLKSSDGYINGIITEEQFKSLKEEINKITI